MEKINLRNAKLLGGIGAILPLVSMLFSMSLQVVGLMLSIASIVLILMSLNEISKKQKLQKYFQTI